VPDPDKIKVLRTIGYKVLEVCGQCKHGRFVPGSNFGTCMVHKYTHAKHGQRNLSVHVAGRCGTDDFSWNEKKVADVERSGFMEFWDTTLRPPADGG